MHAVNESSMQNSSRILQEEFCAVCMFATSERGSFLRRGLRGRPCRPRGWNTKRARLSACARASRDSEKRKMKSAPFVPADRPRKSSPCELLSAWYAVIPPRVRPLRRAPPWRSAGWERLPERVRRRSAAARLPERIPRAAPGSAVPPCRGRISAACGSCG